MTEIAMEKPWDQSLHDEAFRFWKLAEPSALQILMKPSVLSRCAVATVLGLGAAQLMSLMPIGVVSMTHIVAAMVGALAAHFYTMIVMDLARRKSHKKLKDIVETQLSPINVVMNDSGHRWYYAQTDTRYDWSTIDDVQPFSNGVAMRMGERVATLPASSFPVNMTAKTLIDQIEAWRSAPQ